MLKVEYAILATDASNFSTLYKCNGSPEGYEQQGRTRNVSIMHLLCELGEERWILAAVEKNAGGTTERTFYRKIDND